MHLKINYKKYILQLAQKSLLIIKFPTILTVFLQANIRNYSAYFNMVFINKKKDYPGR